jgi:hypothetical protein
VSPGTGVSPGSLRNQRTMELAQTPRQTNDSASFAKFLTPIEDRAPSVDEIFAKNNINDGSSNNIAGGTTNLGVGGSLPMTGGSNKAQQILGDNYARFLALGYKPSEIDAQLDRSLSFGRGIDVDKIEDQLNKFEQFNASDFKETGIAPMIDGQQFLNVSRPEIYANPGEGLGSLLGDMFVRPFADMAGDVMQGMAEGKVGAMGLLNQLKDKFSSSIDNLNQPGTLGFRVGALTKAQRRLYDDLITNQGVNPFQAIKQAEKKAMGGITTLQ